MDTEPEIDPVVMRRGALDACALMRVFAKPDRLMLLCQMADGERTQPTLSQQLSVLRSASLGATPREGKNVYHRMASGPALAVTRVLCAQFFAPAKPSRTRP